ncbi:MAG: hypothetical protein ACLQME_20435 [Alphaproteobacteria bacterium]
MTQSSAQQGREGPRESDLKTGERLGQRVVPPARQVRMSVAAAP